MIDDGSALKNELSCTPSLDRALDDSEAGRFVKLVLLEAARRTSMLRTLWGARRRGLARTGPWATGPGGGGFRSRPCPSGAA